MGSAKTLFLCGGGIIGALALYGFQQERIMALPYGDDAAGGEYFKHTVFLVLNNRIIAGLAGLIMVFIKGESFSSGPAVWKYLVIAISNIGATYCQYEALKYVSFPTQTLGKSMKMVPVMVMSSVLSGKKHSLVDWLVSSIVTAGCVLFLMTGSFSSKRSKSSQNDSLYGLLLLVGYLACDAFTPVLQEKIFGNGPDGKPSKASRYVAMFWTNTCSGLMSTVYLASTGTLQEATGFAMRHPKMLFDATLLSMSATGGQFAIYATIANFGSLVLAAIMNVRQLIQVILSMVVYGHTPTTGQAVGLVMVFGALFYAAENKRKKAEQKKNEGKKSN